MALDYPDIIEKCVVLDILPTSTLWYMTDKDFMIDVFLWAFLAQLLDLSQHLIGLDSDFWHSWIMRAWSNDYSVFPESVLGISLLFSTKGSNRGNLCGLFGGRYLRRCVR